MATPPTDPIADMLTRIRNALMAGQRTVELPPSNVRLALVRVMQDEGFIEKYDLVEPKKPPPGEKIARSRLRIVLKYMEDGEPVLRGLRRVSRPGRRYYRRAARLPRVQGGLGVAVISTSRGLMTDYRARTRGIGGEVICYLW